MSIDLLVVVGDVEIPPAITERASRILQTTESDAVDQVKAHARSHMPEHISVAGSTSTAKSIKENGFAVTLYSNELNEEIEGVEVLPLNDQGPPMEVAESLLDIVGNTPLVRLARTSRDVAPQLLAKLEYLNPGGSVKDRPAITMVQEAERQGLLKPGGTIVEPTSGNTGVGLAIVAARRGYKCVFVAPDKVSQEKINLLRSYGAEVVVCPTAVAPEHPESYYSVSDRLAREIPGAFKPDQYSNPANPLAHELTTGPEIWRQTAGRITHLVAGVGTAGTIVGIAKYLKSQNPNIKIIGADPVGSVYSGGTGRPYLVEGVGEDFFPGNYDPSIIDEVIAVSDQESFLTARKLTQEEGIFTGGSSGMAVAAALKLSERLTHDDVVVVVIPDSGRGYLSKFYNDSWLSDYGFVRSSGPSVNDVLSSKRANYGAIPEIVHVHPHETVKEVASIMREFAVSQVIVVNAEPPLMMGEVIGAASENELLRKAFAEPGVLDEPIGEHTEPIPPAIGTGELVEVAIGRLEKSDVLLVLEDGRPIGILTRSDLLEFLSQSKTAR